MSRNSTLGVVGGILIALAAIMTGDGLNISTDALSSTINLVLFLAGIGVVLFLLMHKRVAASYCAIAATTIAIIAVVDMFRSDAFSVTLKLVFLVVGVILAIMACVGRSRN